MDALLSNINAVYRSQIPPTIGSFWSTLFANPKQVQLLLELVQTSRSQTLLQAAVNDLAGNYEASRQVAHVAVKFDSKAVIQTGMQLYDDPDKQMDYRTLQDYELIYNFFRIPYWVLPIQGVIPDSIQSSAGKLLIGVDFFILKDEYIFFRQDPRVIFPNCKYLVNSGRIKDYHSFISYLLKVQVKENSDYVVQYYRRFQTPKYLGLAMAAVGGLGILRTSEKLQAIQTNLSTTVYMFETQVVRVNYPHTPLVVGTTYPDNYIIGEGIQIFQNSETDSDWWRQVDWRGGLALDPILQDFRGLALIDRDTVAYTAGQDVGSVAGSKVHARVKLSDNFFAEEPYWQYVAARETSEGLYLNALLGLPEDTGVANPSVMDTFAKLRKAVDAANIINTQIGLPTEDPDVGALPNSVRVNALDLFFRAVLSDAGFVVLFDISAIPDPLAVFNFLSREMLIGGTPVVFAYGPDLPIEIMQVGGNIAVTDSVTISVATVLSLSEVVNLTGQTVDKAFITPQRPIID